MQSLVNFVTKMDAGGLSLFIIILCEKFTIKKKHLGVYENVGKRRDEW